MNNKIGIPFSDIFDKRIENIIYFRGILVSGILISIYSAVVLNGYLQNVVISLVSGILSLFIMSSYNLLCDVCIETHLYFLLTFIIVVLSLLIISCIRLCWNKVYQYWS